MPAAAISITNPAASFFIWHVLLLIFVPHQLAAATDSHALPLVFVFGDSTVDVGTNNHLHSKAKANFPHNGVDFPHKRATGRFSNGFNSADSLAQCFNLSRSPPPFFLLRNLSAHHFLRLIFNGVNFASGGSGLLKRTGTNLTVVPLSEQICQFSTVRDNFTAIKGAAATHTLLSKSLFFISVGSNDIFEYFNTTKSQRMPQDKFISLLMSAYSKHITTLYRLGARKFGITSVPPVGCCPSQRLVQKRISGTYDCFHDMNDVAAAFYTALDTLLSNITPQLPNIKYALGDAFNMTLEVLRNPSYVGFENVEGACCGNGTLNAQGPCNASAVLCPDRNKYLFWDMFHPTQKAAALAANILYSGPPQFVSPINFSQLAEDK